MGAPLDGRVMNSMLPFGLTSRSTSAAFAVADSLIITPAFAFASVLVNESIRALMVVSPVIPRLAKLN